jgi:multicomponent Na+:H+ antiporter subunit E
VPSFDGEDDRRAMRRAVSVAAVRGALLVGLWWALIEGRPGGWDFGVPAIAVALGASLVLSPAGGWRLRPLAAARFALRFLQRSGRGGVDVAARALHPRRPVAPAFVDYPLRLPDGAAAVFFANTVSLLPGSLSAALGPGALRVHVLDEAHDVSVELRQMEERVADLFGVRLDGAPSPPP